MNTHTLTFTRCRSCNGRIIQKREGHIAFCSYRCQDNYIHMPPLRLVGDYVAHGEWPNTWELPKFVYPYLAGGAR
jgi:hypothetical protein